MFKIRLFLAITFLFSSVAAKAADKSRLPEAPGRETTLRLCGNCHAADVVLGRAHSEDAWAEIIMKMVERGAPGTEEELSEVIQYLAKNIKAAPKVNVNRASAREIEENLELSAAEAAAIVRAREKSEFQTLEDVKNVPGLNPRKIESKKHQVVL
jgi:competence protein ComEA